MKELMETFLRRYLSLVSAAALFAMAALTVIDVLARKFAGRSLGGATEITEILMVCVIFTALPLVSWRGEHVTFELAERFVPSGWSRVWRVVIDVVCSTTWLGMAGLMTTRMLRFAEYGETTSYLAWPVAPVAGFAALMFALTALLHIVLLWCPRSPATAESVQE